MRYVATVFLCFMLSHAAWAEPFMSPDSVPSAKGFHKEVMADGLSHPWGIVWLPDGSMLVTERPGRVRHLNEDGSTRTYKVPGGPAVVVVGQGGLLDIALHPDYAENGLVYFTLAAGKRDSNRTTLARAHFNGKRFTGLEELFRVSQAKSGGQHFGSRLVWLEDKTLLMSVGDGGNPPLRIGDVLSRKMAQEGSSHLGKILRLTPDGKPAAEAAFEGEKGILPEIYTMGHRNIQGMAVDPIRGTVWASEHGSLGGDELNRIEGGKNYGWPKVTYSKEYFGAQEISEHTSLPGMADPELVWLSGIAPSGLLLYTGDRFPQWRGDLFAGGLKDQSVRRVVLDESGKVLGEEIIRIGQRVREIRQGPDGLIYLLTDESDGKLIRLEPSEETDPNP